MYLKFTRACGNYKADEVSGDLPADIAQTFVRGGYAEEVPSQVYLQNLLRAEMDDRESRQIQRIQEMLSVALKGGDGARGAPNPPGPPTGSAGHDFGGPGAAEDPVARANDLMMQRIRDSKRRGVDAGLGEVLGMVGIVGKPQLFSGEKVQFTARRLQRLCGEAREEVFNANTGRWDTKFMRNLEDGGVETITRTGTDSLSGGTTYGFALKPEVLGNLFEISMEQQVMADAATKIPVSGGIEVKWPAWDQYAAPTTVNGLMQPAVVAGVTLFYEGEAAPRVLTDANLNMINFKIVDLTAFTALSRDFVVDNYLAFDSQLTRMIGRAFGWMEDWVSIQGPGLGKPQGFQNSGATLVVNRHAANTITYNDAVGMMSSASPMVWNELRWLTNITTIPQLAALKDNSGTYVFNPNALITQAMQLSILDKAMGGTGAELMHRPMGSLLGFPVYFTEKVQTLGTTGDLNLVAPPQYGVAERSGLEIAVSEHFYFSTDLIAYRMKKRHDMKSLWRAPYQQADGSNTQVAPFVMLH